MKYSTKRSIPAAVAVAGLAFLSTTAAQSYEEHNLTPDGYWHNRYHAVLSMAAYGDYASTCPEETFTEEAKLRNFPESTRPPWTVVSTFGPTASGCEGYTAIVPEMNKALIIFKGDHMLEENLPTEVTSFDAIGLGAECPNCTVNAFAARGYMECKNETNNFQAIREAYYNSGLVFSIAGHGLGGMHSQIASIDFNVQDICYYSHSYGAPRTFNPAGAQFYNDRFNGEAGERGIAGNDQFTESIPASADYAHAGTPFYYGNGFNATGGGPNWTICWLEDGAGYDECLPRPQTAYDGFESTPLQDHYFYFDNVLSCGGNYHKNLTQIDNYLDGHRSSIGSGSGQTYPAYVPGAAPTTSSSMQRRRSSSSIRGSTTLFG